VVINTISTTVAGQATPYRAPATASTPATPDSGTAASVPEQRQPSRAEQVSDAVRAANEKELEQAVEESVEKINDFISPYVTALQFSVDKEAGKFVVKVMDTETKEVIKQFPSDKILAIAKALSEAMEKPEGLLVEQEA
jgi:flagellar protein FlaG